MASLWPYTCFSNSTYTRRDRNREKERQRYRKTEGQHNRKTEMGQKWGGQEANVERDKERCVCVQGQSKRKRARNVNKKFERRKKSRGGKY